MNNEKETRSILGFKMKVKPMVSKPESGFKGLL